MELVLLLGGVVVSCFSHEFPLCFCLRFYSTSFYLRHFVTLLTGSLLYIIIYIYAGFLNK